jgi:hypothetical protein
MMLILQAVPPVASPAPGSEMSVTGTLEGVAAVVLIARRIEGGSVAVQLQTELDALRERVRQLEEVAPRVAELEERLDFTERIVAQAREPERLQR